VLAAGTRRFFCSAMPWVDCTPLRYHCTKVPGVDLCPQAFAEGRFPPGCCAADFVRLQGGADYGAPDAAAAGKWTPQETLL
jgi:SWI/SNF related-matrix-associated actin-dependent regulator of chromatin subfamily C